MIQDISVYFERCPTHCNSNKCPDTGSYYTHPDLTSCVNDCPDGYDENGGTGCVAFEFCHSTCGNTCSPTRNAATCSTCPTTLSTYLPYNTLTPPGACTLPAANNAQLMLTVDGFTALGSTILKSVTYNGTTTVATTSTVLNTFLYRQNVIEFMPMTTNEVVFSFDLLAQHTWLIVRARVYTECASADVTMILSGAPPTT